jgi:hypothetical protein
MPLRKETRVGGSGEVPRGVDNLGFAGPLPSLHRLRLSVAASLERDPGEYGHPDEHHQDRGQASVYDARKTTSTVSGTNAATSATISQNSRFCHMSALDDTNAVLDRVIQAAVRELERHAGVPRRAAADPDADVHAALYRIRPGSITPTRV